ncbi:lipase family protein [Ectobacillus panaciterrae]|uniref:lipase family protein n=1 Tax=Ectobacillus panaciterrae TaxID=363872 RepID=UPI00048BFDEF|nr:hypothetical protein [Ectobacillus panaciterrae]
MRKSEDTLNKLSALDPPPNLGIQERMQFYNAKERLQQHVEESQFTQADRLVAHVVKEYQAKGYDVSTTGHSLGGGMAEYTAAKYNLKAVTYSAPDVMHLLPKELRERAKQGKFNGQITSYVHPYDSIGAGAFGSYPQHVGSTYYISRLGIHNLLPTSVQLCAPFFIYNVARFFLSIAGVKFHDLDQYTFDENGNLANPYIVNQATKEVMVGSPRQGWGTIEVNAEDLRRVGKQLQSNAMETRERIASSKRAVLSLVQTSHSHGLNVIVNQIEHHLDNFHARYANASQEVAHYIENKAIAFENADQGKG